MPLALLAGCGGGPPPVEVTAGSNASVCGAVTSAARQLGASTEKPAEIREAAEVIRTVTGDADDQELRAAGAAYATAAQAYADALDSGDQAAVNLTRGDLERTAPSLGDECGVLYDQILTF